MTGWHRQLCPRKQSSKANKTMVLYSSDAPRPSLPLQLESIPPNWLQGPFHTIEEKAQLFPLPLATSTHSDLSCAHAGDMDLSYSQNMARCTCMSRGQISYALLDWTCGNWAPLIYLLARQVCGNGQTMVEMRICEEILFCFN